MPPALPLQAALGAITVRIPRRYHCAALPLQATLGAITVRIPLRYHCAHPPALPLRGATTASDDVKATPGATTARRPQQHSLGRFLEP